MADIYGSHFEYGGVSSRNYGLMIVNVQTDRFVSVAGAISGIFISDKSEKRRRLVDNEYEDFPLSFELDIVTDDERCIHSAERRQIEKWLFNRHSFRKLYLDSFDDLFGDTVETIDGVQKRLYLNCRFINPERLEYNGGVVGYRVTLEADSGMWWQDSVEKTISVDNAAEDSVSVITVRVDTDLDEYTYPKVTVKMGSVGGSFTLINNTDDSTRITKFDGIGANASVVLRGGINYVSGQYYEAFCMQNFPRLVDGDNNLTIRGNVESIKFEFNNRRML